MKEDDPTSVTRSGALLSDEFAGLVLSKAEGTVIVEILVTGAIRWSPDTGVMAELADGTQLRAAVLPGGTTRAGEVRPGTRIRVVLRFGRSTEVELRSLSLVNDGRSLTVRL